VKDADAANSHEIPRCEIGFPPDEKKGAKSALSCHVQVPLSKK
jgi:hypothetical protein